MDEFEHAIHLLAFQADGVADLVLKADDSRAPAVLLQSAAKLLHEAAEMHRESGCFVEDFEAQEAMLAAAEADLR